MSSPHGVTEGESTTRPAPTGGSPAPVTVKASMEDRPQIGDERASNDYFTAMGQLQEAVSSREYLRAASVARRHLRQVPGFVRTWKREYGSFPVASIPVLEVGGTMLALAGDDEGLAEMRSLVASQPELEPWRSEVEQHIEDRRLFAAMIAAIEKNPGRLQPEIKTLIDADDGRRVATLISWLEKAGRLVREKKGKTYALWLPGMEGAKSSAPPPKRDVRSHRTDRERPSLREIDVAQLPYIPLPRAPLRWEEARVRDTSAWVPHITAEFEIRDAPEWELARVEKLPPQERPDTAFRELHPLKSGLLMIDDLGKADGFGPIPAAALQYGRDGTEKAKVPLLHGIYRIGVNPMGHGFIALSRDGVLHVYNDALELILETTLFDSPEIELLRKRLEVQAGELKNLLRAVALSPYSDRYLFTTVDEAWCIDMTGQGLWGVKLPSREGWTRISEPAETFGTSEDVHRALSLVGLSYPFAPDDLKGRYRKLAKEWHPDLNPGDRSANKKMQELTEAIELLTGLGEDGISVYTGVRYTREVSRSEVAVEGVLFSMSFSYEVGEIHAADWVYAASFAGSSNRVFLAAYSGRVVEVSEDGEPVRVYDVGSVPRRIVETGEYLYILTDTRLYVLQGEALHALIDTFDGGELIPTQTGFGLLEKKRFRWFGKDGVYVGSVVAKDPIRRVYATQGGDAGGNPNPPCFHPRSTGVVGIGGGALRLRGRGCCDSASSVRGKCSHDPARSFYLKWRGWLVRSSLQKIREFPLGFCSVASREHVK
jgi:hypothetical protein